MPDDLPPIDPHKPEHADATSGVMCPSCEAQITGAFCADCGQRRLRDDEYSLLRLIRDGVQDFLSVDAKFWQSFRLLFTRPGQLTRDYMAGRRGGRLGPFQLFIAANLIYFFVQPYSGFSGFNTPLFSHMDRQFYSEPANIREVVVGEIDERIDARVGLESRRRAMDGVWSAEDSVAFHTRVSAIERELYPTRFDARGEVNARSMAILLVPMLALVLTVLYVGTRTPFVQHVVFATHYISWHLVFLFSILWPLVVLGVRALPSLIGGVGGEAGTNWYFESGTASFMASFLEQGSFFVQLPYFYLALRTGYGSGRLTALGRAVALTVGTLVVTVVYRYAVFWATFVGT